MLTNFTESSDSHVQHVVSVPALAVVAERHPPATLLAALARRGVPVRQLGKVAVY